MTNLFQIFGRRVGGCLALSLPVHADTMTLEVTEFGAVGPAALEVIDTSFPARPGNSVQELQVTLPSGVASPQLARSLVNRQILAAPSLVIRRNPPEPFHILTLFDASIRSIESILPGSPPGALLRDRATLEFSRYERTHTLAPGVSNSIYVDAQGQTVTHTIDQGLPPVLSAIPAQLVPAGARFDIPLVVNDSDTPAAGISLRAVHPVTPLLPPGSIDFSNPGVVTLTIPPLNAGSVPVTMIASDGVNEGYATFLLTVQPPDPEAPVDLGLSQDTLAEDTPNGQIIASIDMVDPTPFDTHTLILEENAGGRFEILGSHLVVANTSLIDFEIYNLHTITITAIDSAGNSLTKSLDLHLMDVVEGAFDRWRAAHFSAAQLADPLVSGLLADPDGDNVSNLAEFNGDSSPLDRLSKPPSLVVGEVKEDKETHPTLTWRQRTAISDPRMEVYPQFSGDAIVWTEGPLAFVVIETVPDGKDHERGTPPSHGL